MAVWFPLRIDIKKKTVIAHQNFQIQKSLDTLVTKKIHGPQMHHK